MPESRNYIGKVPWGRKRLPSLTGMRFIAAAMVFFFHAATFQTFSAPGAQARFFNLFEQGGWSGVGFFFVLSGFVLTWATHPNDSARKFLRRRFFKIYPNYLVAFVAAAILEGVVSHQEFDYGKAILNILLLQAWSPLVQYNTSFNPVSWSLSCEAFFYLMFPVLIWLIVKIRPERLWLYVGAVLGAILLMPIVALALPHQPVEPLVNASAYQAWFIYLFPPVRLLDFIFGILLARIVLTGRKVPLGLGGAAALVILAFLVAPSFPLTYHLTAVTVLPLGLLVAAGAQEDIQGHATWLSSRPMVWLGGISYAFYLVHYLVLEYGHELLGTVWNSAAATGIVAVLFCAAIAIAALLYYGVERPLMRRFGTARSREPLLTAAAESATVTDPVAVKDGSAYQGEEVMKSSAPVSADESGAEN